MELLEQISWKHQPDNKPLEVGHLYSGGPGNSRWQGIQQVQNTGHFHLVPCLEMLLPTTEINILSDVTLLVCWKYGINFYLVKWGKQGTSRGSTKLVIAHLANFLLNCVQLSFISYNLLNDWKGLSDKHGSTHNCFEKQIWNMFSFSWFVCLFD